MSSATSQTFRLPDNFIIDVHDLAALILDAHARTEPLFPHAQLVEINHGAAPLTTFPEQFLHSSWHESALLARKRVAYVLQIDSSAQERTTIDTFASPKGVNTSTNREDTRRELEDVYWRCKAYNNGYLLATRSEVTVAEIDVCPKEACLIVVKEPRPDLGPSKVDMTQHLSGFSDSIPWVFLLIDEAKSTDMEADPRVVLDLVLPQIGGRGGGGEPFALERAIVYHEKALAKVADEFERYDLSGKIRIAEEDIRRRGDALVELVLDRIARIAAGQDHFCRYCGKDGVETRCSKCKKAHFCPPCQAVGWKYHKVWCS